VGVYLRYLVPQRMVWSPPTPNITKDMDVALMCACWPGSVATKIKIRVGAKRTYVATNYENDRLAHYLL
jgi:hypothetical protein